MPVSALSASVFQLLLSTASPRRFRKGREMYPPGTEHEHLNLLLPIGDHVGRSLATDDRPSLDLAPLPTRGLELARGELVEPVERASGLPTLRAEQKAKHWQNGFEPPPPSVQLPNPIQTKVICRVV